MEVKQRLLDILDTFGYPVKQQGSLGSDEYPEHFFTYWNNNTESAGVYDNGSTANVWDFDLNFYSTDISLANNMLKAASTALREKGFLVDGEGYDIASDVPTHKGRGINIQYLEIKGGKE